ncbi:hypothetical protein NKR17_21185 [Priestia flexa]|uniref:hypothetical protein n=1 Tax=Priestia flexa TaxID=86664 RepID=UPI00209C713F|nr:hypothetical protein [Priestia flexa]MCP1191539.1 hypothetical protein [Priestia flexa]
MNKQTVQAHLDELKTMITQLEQQNMTSITSSQRECNEHMINTFQYQVKATERRLRLIENGYYDRNEQHTDIVLEAHKRSNFRCTPRSMLAL